MRDLEAELAEQLDDVDQVAARAAAAVRLRALTQERREDVQARVRQMLAAVRSPRG